MRVRLFEAFCGMINRLPVNDILLTARLQGEMIQIDLQEKRGLPMEDAVSVLNFCRFLQKVTLGEGIFPVLLPLHHIGFYQKIVKRLVEAGKLSCNAIEQFNMTFLSFYMSDYGLLPLINNKNMEHVRVLAHRFT